MNTKLLKKWRTIADEMFFKDFSIDFKNQLQINIPEFYTWKDYYGHARFRQGNGRTSFYKDECIHINDLKSKLQKAYKTFVDEFLKYMTLKTKPL